MSTTTTPGISIVTTEHPNAARLREGFAAFARGDLDHVRSTMAEDCTWTNAGTSPLAGTYRGWDEIQGMFIRLFEITGGTNRMDLVHVLGDDACSVAVYDSTATVAGETRTMRFVMTEELSDGLATSVHTLAYDQPAADAHLAGIPQQR